MNTTVAVIILAFWAVLATIVMLCALRSLSAERRHAATYKRRMEQAYENAEQWKRLADSRKTPARDGSDGISLARAMRKITGPVKPTSARTPSTSRSSSPDVMNGSLVAPTVWSGNYGSPDPSPSTSCDTSSTSSSSSSDGGSCGGGE